jgi:PAS domain S-box-containing protein
MPPPMFEYLQRLFSKPQQPAKPKLSPTSTASLEAAVESQNMAEAGLLQSEEHFAQLVAGVRDYAVLLLDRNGIVLTWNAGAERLKGYRPEEIIGQHFSRFYPRESVSAGWPTHELKVAVETGRFEEENWRLRKDGSKFWASVVITALRGPDREVRGFLKITRDLTDRKQTEERLKLSEERFRLLVDSVSDYAVFMLDPDGRIATWNVGAQRLKQYGAEEIIGQHFSKFYTKADIERNWPAEELRIATTVGRFEDEGLRVRKDGTTFWANVVITPVKDESGILRGYAKVTRDLTERKAAEESQRRLLTEEVARRAAEEWAHEIDRQREQLQVTLSSIGDAVIVTDGQGIVTFLNPVASELTGWNLEEATDKPLESVFRIVNETTLESIANPVTLVFLEGNIVTLANDAALIAKNGKTIPIEDSAAPIRSKSGEIEGAVLVFRDVTEMRRAVETRLRLAAIVESSDDAIIGETLDGKILSWNKGARQLYGYSADEAIGQPLSILIPRDHPDELPDLMERIARAESVDHFETQRVRKDGSLVDVALTISPILNAYGKVVGASKIARDVSARKLEDRRKNEFLAVLAHELRNPLASLRNGLQVLRLADNDRAALAQARPMMERQLQHLVRLVDDLLDVSRISQGKLQLRKERLSLGAVVAHALEVIGQHTDHGQHELTVKVPEEPTYVDADKTRLAQAISNLVNNAIKYSDPGSQIWVTAEHRGNEAVIMVKDNGVGIETAMLGKVFDMFTQIDRSLEQSQGGLGVGLNIVKQLVEMHGGTVTAHSAGLGKGSEFSIHLPVVLAVHQQQDSSGDEPAATSTRHRILVVDDNRDAASSMAMMLQMMGNDVRTANDGLAGIQVAEAFFPDLILLDIGMPKLNGFDTCRRIREQPWGKNVVIVALTGWGQDEDKQRSQEAGFDSHVVKPVDPATLEQLLVGLKAATG